MNNRYPHNFVASDNDPDKCAMCFKDVAALNPYGNSIMAHHEPPWDDDDSAPKAPEPKVISPLTVTVEMECYSCRAKTHRELDNLTVGSHILVPSHTCLSINVIDNGDM